MKILHINTSDTAGGAARGCYWLHQALRKAGVDSQMLVLRKFSRDPSVHSLGKGALGKLQSAALPRLDSLPTKLLKKNDAGYWSTDILPNNVVQAINEINPDLINLHWVGGGFVPIAALSKLEQPIVWTMRDMWPMTGGCHYTNGCRRFEKMCGSCPQLNTDSEWDLSRLIWYWKNRHWKHREMHLIPISEWLKECAERSSVLGNQPMTMIPNGISLEKFKPIEKSIARRILGLPQQRRLVLFGALSSTRDRRKGFHLLRDALEHLADSESAADIDVVVFGNDEKPEKNLSLPSHYLGRLNDETTLALAYSAADVMVVPSIEEAFGKTVIEAMACRTPVVAFDTGGPRDIIEHRVNGYLADELSAEDLANGIAWTIENDMRLESMRSAALRRVQEVYDIDLIAKCYTELYQSILGQNAQNIGDSQLE